jgi:Mg2+ and Co2+ transporter CorA
MAETMNQGAKDGETANGTDCDTGRYQHFDDIAGFSRAIETTAGTTFDLASLTQLNTDFVEAADNYLLLNVKEYGVAQPDNMIFLMEDKAFVFSANCPSSSEFKSFETVLPKPFGTSTVVSFLVLDHIVDNHKKQLAHFLDEIKKQEQTFDRVAYSKLSLEIERLSDRLEEFHDLLLELQERRYKQLQFQYISFDYRVLIAESQSLQGRSRRRIDSLKRLQQDHEIRASEELNIRILKLNAVVTRLTAITVIFMLPTLIASHFGMNFQHMPELQMPWSYPLVITAEIASVVVSIMIFRKVGWL